MLNKIRRLKTKTVKHDHAETGTHILRKIEGRASGLKTIPPRTTIAGTWKFTERQKIWIREYFRSAFNASRAARVAYGGTPISCRVKGWRKRRKFEKILEEMFDQKLFMMQGGVDVYLRWLEQGDRRRLQEIEQRRRRIGSEYSDLWPYPVRKHGI